MLDFTLERYDPSYDAIFFPNVSVPHWVRYRWAAPYCKNKRVLDIACGTGYGTNLLAQTAVSVLGVDQGAQTIAYCQQTYPNCGFVQGDATTFALNEPVDVVVSLETIEHIQEVDAFLRCVVANLTADGLFICSTPIHGAAPMSPHHVKEYSAAAFQALLARFFDHISLHTQKMCWLVDEQQMDQQGLFLLALCSQPIPSRAEG